jgi:hypothetical protein
MLLRILGTLAFAASFDILILDVNHRFQAFAARRILKHGMAS